MTDLPHAIRITMLLREFNRSDKYLCSSYLQPGSPADLNYDNTSPFYLTINEVENVHCHVGIVNRLCTSFRFDFLEENQIGCLIFTHGLRSPCHTAIQLKLLSPWIRNPMSGSLVANPNLLEDC
ncbi:unnamed protein product [Hymenolepis diminuta]|uniref:Uncharacterized protein n=1 Tax=Hymenolepis diminuta TaxID=6216 RepID=A0A0R3SAX6_HYMDI|nr:unnamed protein product [Hymenolepis diminuta]